MSDETDINDVFDDILLSEDRIIGEAYEEGFVKGKSDGEIDGFHAGYHGGRDIGYEIGYYKGVVNCISSEVRDLDQKTGDLLRKLGESVESFPKANSGEIDLFQVIRCVRARYRKLCSVMKLKLAYPTTTNMTF